MNLRWPKMLFSLPNSQYLLSTVCFLFGQGRGVLKQIQTVMNIVSKTIIQHLHLDGFYHPLDWFTIGDVLTLSWLLYQQQSW